MMQPEESPTKKTLKTVGLLADGEKSSKGWNFAIIAGSAVFVAVVFEVIFR